MEKIVLIDGQSLLYKMYYSVAESTDVENANTCFCFLHSFLKFFDYKPDCMAVFFEKEADSMPFLYRNQLRLAKEYMEKAGVYCVEVPSAREQLLYLAKNQLVDKELYIVTSDVVLQQCINQHVRVLHYTIDAVEKQWTLIDETYIQQVYGVSPDKLCDIFAIAGNREDKIFGANGIGVQTASKLIREHNSVEEMLENLENLLPVWIKRSVMESAGKIPEYKAFFAKIAQGQDINLDECKVNDELVSSIQELIKSFTLSTSFMKNKKEIKIEPQIVRVNNKDDIDTIFANAKKGGNCSFRFLVQDHTSQEMGSFENGQMFLQFEQPKSFCKLFLCVDGKIVYLFDENNDIAREDITSLIQGIIQLPGMSVSCFAEKEHYQYLFSDENQRTLSAKQLVNGLFDCNIAAYLLNPLISEYTVSDVAREYLGVEIAKWDASFGKTDLVTAFSDREPECVDFFAKETLALYLLYEVLQKKLSKTSMLSLMQDLEMPLSFVLFDMEREGILVKPDELKKYGEALQVRIAELEQTIYAEAGEEFNINSPKQLGVILFEKMMLPGGKKTKSGYSTAAEVLEKLAPEYPFVNQILEYRQLTKLKSTYAEGLAAYIGEDKRIHTHFNQTITATGRLSSTEPNLQNIPMRMELGRRIRKVFIPADNCIFMDADYSQIELRVLAHMSQDEQLIEAYKMDEDIHRITASKVFHIPFDEVTDLQRRNAKAVNFGIVYGISSFGLSQDLSISPKEAKVYIDEYFKTYPKIKEFLDHTIEETRNNGYCSSMFGRRRPVPEIKSSNHMQKAFGERIAMNSPIQGTAADLIKMAMLHVYDALKEAGLKSKLILQIHDELLIETRSDEVEQVREILAREMKQVCDMDVSLEIDLHTGNDWYEAK